MIRDWMGGRFSRVRGYSKSEKLRSLRSHSK
jgi:hypothetical protein